MAAVCLRLESSKERDMVAIRTSFSSSLLLHTLCLFFCSLFPLLILALCLYLPPSSLFLSLIASFTFLVPRLLLHLQPSLPSQIPHLVLDFCPFSFFHPHSFTTHGQPPRTYYEQTSSTDPKPSGQSKSNAVKKTPNHRPRVNNLWT